LVSLAKSGVKVLTLRFGGFVPLGTVWESSDFEKMAMMFADLEQPATSPLDAILARFFESAEAGASIESLKLWFGVREIYGALRRKSIEDAA